MIISVTYNTLSGLEYNSVLIGAGIWYQTNPVPDIRDGSIVSVLSIISAISILSLSYRIGVYNIGFSDISISYR